MFLKQFISHVYILCHKDLCHSVSLHSVAQKINFNTYLTGTSTAKLILEISPNATTVGKSCTFLQNYPSLVFLKFLKLICPLSRKMTVSFSSPLRLQNHSTSVAGHWPHVLLPSFSAYQSKVLHFFNNIDVRINTKLSVFIGCKLT